MQLPMLRRGDCLAAARRIIGVWVPHISPADFAKVIVQRLKGIYKFVQHKSLQEGFGVKCVLQLCHWGFGTEMTGCSGSSDGWLA